VQGRIGGSRSLGGRHPPPHIRAAPLSVADGKSLSPK
jgi:hypothetical protein